MPEPWNLTWRCHVCGEERPDARISVHVVKDDATPVTANVRYCNDRPACAEGAEAIGRSWLGLS